MKKTILITGAGSGIGKDTAIALAKNGHTVIATTESEAQVTSLSENVKALGLNIEVKKLDITNPDDQKSISEYDLDVLINVAGIGQTGPLAEVPLERVRMNFETNVFGTLAVTQIALKRMLTKKSGTVITVSSVAGRIPQSFLSPYSMTKYALSGGMAAMREEIHQIVPDVHITLIEPGAYATGFNQRMLATKYEWLNEQSFFWKMLPELKKKDDWFKKVEMKSTETIVNKIVSAAEAKKPRLRYVAPWYQGVFVRLLRILGR